MKRLILLATLLFLGSALSAQMKKGMMEKGSMKEDAMPEKGKVKVHGKLEVQGIKVNNATDLAGYDAANYGTTDDKISEMRSRLMFGIGSRLTDDVEAKIKNRKNNRLYGTGAETVNGEFFTAGDLNNLWLDNAYVKIKNLPAGIALKLGRNYLGDPNDLVLYFGPAPGDTLAVTAVDGIKAHLDAGKNWTLAGLLYKAAELGAVAPGGIDRDTDLSGVVATKEWKEKELKLKTYYYSRQNRGAAFTGYYNRDDRKISGAKLEGCVPGTKNAKGKIEYAMNGGSNNSTDQAYEGSAMILAGGYEGFPAGSGRLDGWIEYASGTGDETSTANTFEAFTPVASDLRYGEIWANTLGNTGLTNLSVIKAAVKLREFLSDKLLVKLAYYKFSADEVAAGVSDDWGNEIDLRLKWMQNEDVTLSLILAQLDPGSLLQAALGAAKKDAITKMTASVDISF